jgi:hypothetical protein
MDRQEIKLALRARLLAVAELPDARAWQSVNFVPSALVPHVTESFVPGASRLLTMPAEHATVETTGLYVIGVFGLTNQGDDPIQQIVAGILAAFPPGYAWLVDSGDRLEIRGDVAPIDSQILPVDKHKSRANVTIPWRVWSRNRFPTSLTA